MNVVFDIVNDFLGLILGLLNDLVDIVNDFLGLILGLLKDLADINLGVFLDLIEFILQVFRDVSLDS